MRGRLALGALLACLGTPLAAEPAAMAAVGVLSIGGNRACSGTLVAPDLVLTAAHCVVDEGGVATTRGMRFRTGAYPGRPTHHVAAADVVVHPLFMASPVGTLSRLRHDAGLVRLRAPVPGMSAMPMEVIAPETNGAVAFLASYRAGQGPRARERRCPILAAARGIVSLSCDVRPGESGSPIVVTDGGRIALIGIVSASSQVKRTEVALAAEAQVLLPGLRAMMGDP